MSEQSKPPSSDPRFDVLKMRAVLNLNIRHVVEPADSEDTTQATHVKSLQPIDVGLEQGPCLGAVQENGQDACLIEAKLCDKA
jgi:hypothetical protein